MNEPSTSSPPASQESRKRYALFYPPRTSVPLPKGAKPDGVRPGEPWTGDYPWRPQGMLPDYARDTGKPLLWLAGVVGLICLLNVILLWDVPRPVHLAVVLLDLLGLFVLFNLILKTWQTYRAPRTRMRWATFPAFLGSRLEGTLSVRPGQHVFSELTVKLRCVEDVKGEGGFEPQVLYEQTLMLMPPGEILTELPLSFALPADLPGNQLDRAEATYWQVAIRIPVTGPDVEAVFLAPVYSKS